MYYYIKVVIKSNKLDKTNRGNMIEHAILDEARKIRNDYPEKTNDEIIRIIQSIIRTVITKGGTDETEATRTSKCLL